MYRQPKIILIIRKINLLILLSIASTSNAATIVVDTYTDGTGAVDTCELRDAITAANSDSAVDGCAAGNGDDRIEFNLSIPAGILLNSALPLITESLEIIGPGSDKLFIDGDDKYKILNADFMSGAFRLEGIQLFQGYGSTGGCLEVQRVQTVLVEDVRIESCATDSGNGGGAYIANAGSVAGVTFRKVAFNNNKSIRDGGGLRVASTNVTIEDCTFSENKATENSGSGGALTVGSPGPAVVRRSTFWNNSADTKGTAIHTFSAGVELTIEHSTISNNSLTGTAAADSGGAINGFGPITLFNTVVAGNIENSAFHDVADISNFSGGAIISRGYNFIGNNEGATTEFPAGVQPNGDRVGTAVAPLNAKLQALSDNGGPTSTAMPGLASPLVDRGSCPEEIADQRGYLNLSTGFRPIDAPGISDADDGCDIGAAEVKAQQPEPQFEDGFESS